MMDAIQASKTSNFYVPRIVSLIVLLAIILLVGTVFFQVMVQFIVPLFLACVLLVIFQPFHRWFCRKTPRCPRIAALLTTMLIVFTVLVPTLFLGWKAYVEIVHRMEDVPGVPADRENNGPAVQTGITISTTAYNELLSRTDHWVARLKACTGIVLPVPPRLMLHRAASWLANLWPLAAMASAHVCLGLLIMIVALYYFLADGPSMINGMMLLSPMDWRHELELLVRFAELSRSVVMATLLSAIAQGVLAGIGFYFALPSGSPVFLLTALTMVMAIVPFIGAAGVWVPVCGIIHMFGENVFVRGGAVMDGGHWPVALALAAYGIIFVSGVDNVIKPLVLRGRAHLHPLLALLSILGGVQVLGPVGILVGPMLGSFLQALLAIFLKEVRRWEDPRQKSPVLSPGAQALSEHIQAAVETVEANKKGKKTDHGPGASESTLLEYL